MVSPIKSISGQTRLQDLIGYETTTDLAIIAVTALSFYTLIYPNFKTWDKKQIKTIFKASTPYLIAIAMVSALSTGQKTPLEPTLITAASVLIFSASLNYRSNIKNLKGLYPEITLGTVLLLFMSSYTGFPSISIIFRLIMLSLAATATVTVFLYFSNLRNDRLVLLPIWAHFVDAASTVIALENSLTESRLLAKLFIEFLGPYGIFLMKAFIIVPATFFAVSKLDEKHFLLAIYIISALGFVLGIRNILLI